MILFMIQICLYLLSLMHHKIPVLYLRHGTRMTMEIDAVGKREKYPKEHMGRF